MKLISTKNYVFVADDIDVHQRTITFSINPKKSPYKIIFSDDEAYDYDDVAMGLIKLAKSGEIESFRKDGESYRISIEIKRIEAIW